ncbi:MAG: alpha/beta fold hydrolase [Vicinamibacterales bacterium]
MATTSRQRIHYVTASDGVRLAWADSGRGAPIVKAANWLTHLEYEWESPVWKHWLQFFADRFRLVRFDERGCGMSEWTVGHLSVDRWVADLESVIEAAAIETPITLLGISQGAATCITYAAKRPERVARLILYGSYARGSWRRGVERTELEYRAMVELTRLGWGRDNPTFRQIFTSRFIPGGSDEHVKWFNQLCLKTTTGELAAELFEARAQVDVTSMLGLVRAPTLVLHARDDQVTPIYEGRLVAAGINGAEFVELDSRNHILLESEPAWSRFRAAVLEFVGGGVEDAAFSALSGREREILGLIADGLSNLEIAVRLAISEKTVRNHTSNIFDKLGVWTRAQAIVFARDRHFSE